MSYTYKYLLPSWESHNICTPGRNRKIWRHENNFMGQWGRTLTWIVPRKPVKMGSVIVSVTDI